MTQVTADYRAEEPPRQHCNAGDHGWQSNLLDLTDDRFGDLPADDLGPRKLSDIRKVLIDRDNSRGYVNKQI